MNAVVDQRNETESFLKRDVQVCEIGKSKFVNERERERERERRWLHRCVGVRVGVCVRVCVCVLASIGESGRD